MVKHCQHADVARATSARVTYRNGRWHICFTTPPAEKITAGTGDAAGIDRGLRTPLPPATAA